MVSERLLREFVACIVTPRPKTRAQLAVIEREVSEAYGTLSKEDWGRVAAALIAARAGKTQQFDNDRQQALFAKLMFGRFD